MKVIITQVVEANHLEVEDAVKIALRYRQAGLRTEIISDAEYKRRGINDNQQDLTKIKDWSDVR